MRQLIFLLLGVLCVFGAYDDASKSRPIWFAVEILGFCACGVKLVLDEASREFKPGPPPRPPTRKAS